MKVPHSDFAKITRVVLVEICSVMMLSTSHTSSTGMLAMFPHTTVTSGDITATIGGVLAFIDFHGIDPEGQGAPRYFRWAYLTVAVSLIFE